ncbi:MAG TPA: hypothetical protein PKC42_03370, partial [Candidatus Nanoperiomorbaceae bacterium]|nr:hypothetical protein [Candidatus Nanoperiomorbaceae bacterium]
AAGPARLVAFHRSDATARPGPEPAAIPHAAGPARLVAFHRSGATAGDSIEQSSARPTAFRNAGGSGSHRATLSGLALGGDQV